VGLRFGTDGVRGVAGTELTPELVLALGRAAARVLCPVSATSRRIVVARDSRRSGPLLEAAFAAGAAAEGVDVERLGVLPTPGHTEGHQSLVVRRADGTVVLAGQAHDTASEYTADHLAARAARNGSAPPLPVPSPWLARLEQFDPARVLFAHDMAVWEPT